MASTPTAAASITNYYIVPTGNETAGMYEIFKFVGVSATEGLLFPVMLLVIWIVSFMALKQYSTSRAFAFASFFCTILGIFLAVMDLMAPKWMYLLVFLTVVGLVWLKLEATPQW
jgi:hypothetical protein